jgi:hypothetical protein
MTKRLISPTGLIAAAIALGIAVRLAAALFSYNFDVESYQIVASLMQRGENVYAFTPRYNYGPVWFWILHLLDSLSQWFSDPASAFRFLIAVFLTFVDLGIFVVMWRRFGRDAAALALLNGIAIIITGFHRQFDNFAILIAMLAVLCYEADDKKTVVPDGITARKVAAYSLLGVSLMIKHIFFLFPLWLAFRERSWRGRAWALALPVVIFLLGFVPYLPGGRDGISQNVFHYRPLVNAPLWNLTVRPLFGELISPMLFFLLGLLVAGYLARRTRPMKALLLYTLVLVCFAPAMANQYLAIVVPAVSVFRNSWFRTYTVIGTLFLIGNRIGGGMDYQLFSQLVPQVNSPHRYELLTGILFAGVLWLVCGPRVRIWLSQVTALPSVGKLSTAGLQRQDPALPVSVSAESQKTNL